MKKMQYRDWGIVLAVGSVWGVVEATAGVALRGSCARLLSGSILLGTMMFFASTTYSFSRKRHLVLLLPLMALMFKLYSALIMAKPVVSGGIINPIYAFFTESLAFFLILVMVNPLRLKKVWGQACAGGMAALLAVSFFPSVGFFTGIPACVLPGTRLPLALWGAPVAIGLSMISVPAGFAAGRFLVGVEAKSKSREPLQIMAYTSVMIVLSLWSLFLIYR